MERDYGNEIDCLKDEIDEIKSLLKKLTSKKESNERLKENVEDGDYIGHIKKNRNMHCDENIMKLMNECEDKAGLENLTGCITYLGVFASGGNQSSWISKKVNTDNLLNLIENGSAEKAIACIGSQEKLNIISALLKKPMSVSDLVEQLHFGSTGQAYHHLRTLISADFVKEEDDRKGYYHVVPHRVQGIIMILAGISDLLDEKYSSGKFIE